MLSDRIQRQVDRLLDEAEEAIALRQWEHLRAHCEAVLSLDPDNSDAARYLILASDSLIADVVSDSSDVAQPSQDQILEVGDTYEFWNRSSKEGENNARSSADSHTLCNQVFGIRGRINREGFIVRVFPTICLSILFVLTVFVSADALLERRYSSIHTANFALVGFSILFVFSLLVVGYGLSVVISAMVRRFHDFNWGGLSIFLLFIPLINIVIVFVLLLRSGTQGTNDYGHEPVDLAVGHGHPEVNPMWPD